MRILTVMKIALAAYIAWGIPAMATAQTKTLSDIDLLMIERDCQALSLDYGYALDANDGTAMAALFAQDGVWDLRKIPPLKGRAAIQAYGEKLAKGRKHGETHRHVITNTRIFVKDRDHATGKAYLALYRYFANEPASTDVTSPSIIVAFEDEYVRTSEGWRFKSRTSMRVRP